MLCKSDKPSIIIIICRLLQPSPPLAVPGAPACAALKLYINGHMVLIGALHPQLCAIQYPPKKGQPPLTRHMT